MAVTQSQTSKMLGPVKTCLIADPGVFELDPSSAQQLFLNQRKEEND